MDEDNAVTAAQEGHVDLADTTQAENTGSEATNQETTPEPDKKDYNSQAKELRLAKEAFAQEQITFKQDKRDMDVFKKYGTSYGFTSEAELIEQCADQGITSLEDFEMGIKADEQGVDPAVFREMQEMRISHDELKRENDEFKRKESFTAQSEALKDDRVYKEAKDEIIKIATEGKYDLSVARLLYIDKNPEIVNYDEEAMSAKHVKAYLDGLRNGNKPIEGKGKMAVEEVVKDQSYVTARANALKRTRGQL